MSLFFTWRIVSTWWVSTLTDLPDEVLSEIFIRLLAKQLVQMRSVCKPWNALLSDSSFVKSHLHHSINNKDEILFVFEMMFFCKLCPTPFAVRLSRSPRLELDLTNFIKLPVIPKCEHRCGFLIGSVNGLICFSYRLYYEGHILHICNPSLSALLTLPSCPFTSRDTLFGFGFDPKTDDYKVLRVTGSEVGPQTEVYSMRKGFWKLISQKLPLHVEIFLDQNQVCVDDHLLWLGATDSDMKSLTILGFDLGAETYFVMPLPYSLVHHLEDRFNVLGVLSGKVCVMSCVESGSCEVWVMDEYGVSDSWVKHLAFPPFSGHIFPYGFTLHGEFLFQVDRDDDRFGLYDPVAAKTKTFKIMFRNSSEMIFLEYVDSLVWVPPPKSESSRCDISQLQISN